MRAWRTPKPAEPAPETCLCEAKVGSAKNWLAVLLASAMFSCSSATPANSGAPQETTPDDADTSATTKPEDKADARAKQRDQEGSEFLEIDPSIIRDDAPALRSGKLSPSPAGSNSSVAQWVDLGPISVPKPPGWQHDTGGEDMFFFLSKEEQSAAVIFATFDEPSDGAKKIDLMTDKMGFKETRWQKAKAVTLGADRSLPALFTVGTAKDRDGKGMRLFFALIKTGAPINVLALGGQDDDAQDKDGLDYAIGIVALAKKSAANGGK